jgi:cobalt/nickel transport system permease protein
MHIPENYLSPSTCLVMTAAMAPVWGHAVKKVSRDMPREKTAMIGVGAAFSFVGMMFNVPLPGGTTGHAVGGTLIAILLGPDAACLAVSTALLLQALLFGDGGILAYGANCFNMAFVLPYLGYGIYRLLRKAVGKQKADNSRVQTAAAAAASYVGINAAAFCTAVELGLQPLLFHDASGQALYCPYDLSISVPAMMAGHLTVFGLAEAVFTAAIFGFVWKTSPSLIRPSEEDVSRSGQKPLYLLLSALIVCVPLGLIAQGTAWGEWGAEEIASTAEGGSTLGYVPSAIASGFSIDAWLADYSAAGLPAALGYILSAVVGAALLIIFFRLLSARKKTVKA